MNALHSSTAVSATATKVAEGQQQHHRRHHQQQPIVRMRNRWRSDNSQQQQMAPSALSISISSNSSSISSSSRRRRTPSSTSQSRSRRRQTLPTSSSPPPTRNNNSNSSNKSGHGGSDARGEAVLTRAAAALPTATPTTASSTRMDGVSDITSVATNNDSPAVDVRVSVRDITAILHVDVRVAGFQYDASIMQDPEFLITTRVVFQSRQLGTAVPLETSWTVYRSFHEFYGLDTQLRAEFPLLMVNTRPPRLHKRRTLLRLHKTRTFLTRRSHELHAYVDALLANSRMRLNRFLDPRAPLVLRCFCNFDAGFARGRVIESAITKPVLDLRLDAVTELEPRESVASDEQRLAQVVDADAAVRSQERELQHQQSMRATWRADRSVVAGSQLDDLEAHLLDDRARGLTMCHVLGCHCQYARLVVAQRTMARILQLHGLRLAHAPPRTAASALECVLVRLQQYNDLDKRLYDALTGVVAGGSARAQLAQGVAVLRHALANYGLLYVHVLAQQQRANVMDLTTRLHAVKSNRTRRVGSLELLLLATMLDLSVTLIANDHSGSHVAVEPLDNFPRLRLGGRIHVTLGYLLPTLDCLDGFYVLAERPGPSDAPRVLSQRALQSLRERREREGEGVGRRGRPDDDVFNNTRGDEWTGESVMPTDSAVRQRRRRMWLGVEEMERCLIAAIDAAMRAELTWLSDAFDHRAAESLNQSILAAVWDDCQHNPNLFHLFETQARQFGRARTSATFFFQYLEVAFGLEGATYLVDFLLHVLPEEALRRQLLRARWFRVRRQLHRRVSPASPPPRRASAEWPSSSSATHSVRLARRSARQ